MDSNFNNTSIKDNSLNIEHYSLNPLEHEFSARKMTEIQSALEIFKINQEPSDYPFLTTSDMTKEVLTLFTLLKEKGLTDLGATLWGSTSNAYQFLQLIKEIKRFNYLENRQIVQLFQGNRQISEEILQDIYRQLINTSLKAAVCFLRTVKIGTLLLDPQTKALSRNLIDGSTHALGIVIHTKPEKPEFYRNPHNVTWKDTAHKVFKISVSTLNFIASTCNLAQSLGYLEVEDPVYKFASQLATACMVSDIAYGLLQMSNLVQKRNY